MESLQHTGSDSLSYRWFLNLKPCYDEDDAAETEPETETETEKVIYYRSSIDVLDHGSSYIEMDPSLAHSKRVISNSRRDTSFDFPAIQTLTLLHADELFSNGLLMPLQLLSPPKLLQSPSPPAAANHVLSRRPQIPPSESSKIVISTSGLPSAFIQRCRSSSKRIFHKYLGFLRPLYRRVRGKRSTSPRMVNCVESLQTTPRTSITISTSTDWCHTNLLFDSDIENLIYEAVLHCKKSTTD